MSAGTSAIPSLSSLSTMSLCPPVRPKRSRAAFGITSWPRSLIVTEPHMFFVYVAKDEVEYTVRYLDKTTGAPVVVDGVPTPDKVVKTRNAVVTETFKQLKGYAPDAYQKQLVLAAENNEIIFWYVKDDAHAPVRVIHWQQNLEGDGYTEHQSSTNLNGVIGTEYSEEPLTIAGFRYNGEKSNAKGTLTARGLVLNLYYDRIEYPYEFRFVEKDSNPEKQLAESVTGTARYQKLVVQRATDIPGYTLVSAENQSIQRPRCLCELPWGFGGQEREGHAYGR